MFDELKAKCCQLKEKLLKYRNNADCGREHQIFGANDFTSDLIGFSTENAPKEMMKWNEQMCLKSHWSVAIVIALENVHQCRKGIGGARTFYCESKTSKNFPYCIGFWFFGSTNRRLRNSVWMVKINWSRNTRNWLPGNERGCGFWTPSNPWFIQVRPIAKQNGE